MYACGHESQKSRVRLVSEESFRSLSRIMCRFSWYFFVLVPLSLVICSAVLNYKGTHLQQKTSTGRKDDGTLLHLKCSLFKSPFLSRMMCVHALPLTHPKWQRCGKIGMFPSWLIITSNQNLVFYLLKTTKPLISLVHTSLAACWGWWMMWWFF